ncbi:MAG TPA: fatty acid desaturase, partial [Wenzhouxiangella sp.]|nr:fatty acid desaturase [Wenzhouxiangella sp.]
MEKTNSKPPLVVSNVVFFVAVNLLGFVAAPIYGLVVGFSGWAWLAAALIWIASGLSITVGYHRLWSHRAFRAAWPLRLALAFFGTFSLQNSILVWAARHRVHHRHVDDVDKDPHSILSGFWHAHMGWMTRHWKTSDVNYAEVPDLEKDPIVMWQHKLYWPAVWVLNLGFPAALGWLAGDVIGMILLAGAFRLALSQHFTFFINSLAHTWGRRNYSLDNTARDNGWIALMTWGEGYHNFHHAFQADYRNGLRWWQFDPSKWLISFCAWLGMARDLKRTPAFKIHRARLQTRFNELEQYLSRPDASSTWRKVFEQEL